MQCRFYFAPSLAVVLMSLCPLARAAECDDSWSNHKAQTTQILADVGALTDPTYLGYAWAVTCEAFQLAAKLHNADEDVRARRMGCVGQTWTPAYVSVPSCTLAPPPGMTLQGVLELLENARQQIEAEFSEIDGSYLPCTACMRDAETLTILTPISEFIGQTSASLHAASAEEDPCKNSSFCEGNQSHYDQGIAKRCDPSGSNCQAVPGAHQGERFVCGLARPGATPTCRAQIRWPCGPFGLFDCGITYDEGGVLEE